MSNLKTAAKPQQVDVQALVRQALREGRPDDAMRLTGRAWRVCALVEHGDARGRTIGFPTANMHLDENEPLRFGIYAVRVQVPGVSGQVTTRHDGVASFGIRPMFRTTKPLLEAHLFDFSGDLYGKELVVELIAWLRAEATFSGLDALVAQITADAGAARAILGRTP
jgi:riboflavin kinase/FMN adenylyltransferase